VSQELADLLAVEDVEAFNARRNERSRPDLFAADLAGKKLPGVDLSNANMEKADLTGSDLSDANLMKALAMGVDGTGARLVGAIGMRVRFKEAYLDDSDLSEADFTQGDFADAVLDGSKGSGVRFAQGRLRGVSAKKVEWPDCELHEAKLHKADFTEADLRRADFTEASGAEIILVGANLDGMIGNGAKFPEGNFEGASLLGARLSGANLSGARLVGANLAAADLSRANLSGADLSGADLSGATLAEASLAGAILEGANLSDADFSGIDAHSIGLDEATIAGLSAHGVPFDADAALVFDKASFGSVGGRVGMVWINPDGEEAKSVRWGSWANGAFTHGAVPVPADTVLDAQLAVLGDELLLVLHRVRPDGIVLEVCTFTDAGPGPARSLPLGYEPMVHPVLRALDGTLYMWGIARRGPTIVVHRLEEDGLVIVNSEKSATAKGFLGGMPVLAGKGGVLTPVGPNGLGAPRRAPEGFPGQHAIAAEDDGDLLCVWALARRGDTPGGLRFARIERRGTPEVEVVSLVSGITAVSASFDGDIPVMAWLEAGDDGMDPVTPWICRLPQGAPMPMAKARPDTSRIVVGHGAIGVVHGDGSADIFTLTGEKVASISDANR